MPISIQCSSCKTKLNVGDQFAGKKAKCPKCAQLIAIPGGNPAAVKKPAPAAEGSTAPVKKPAPAPAGTKEPAKKVASAPAPAAKQKQVVKLPLLSFEELKDPRRLRKSIEDEVGDEEIVWMGRPTPESMLSKAKIGMWAGIPLSLLTLGGMVAGMVLGKDPMVFWISLGIGGVVLLTMALPLATMPIWVRKLINYRDCYVITNKRAIVFDNEAILWAKAKPYTPEELADRELVVGENGEGCITFGHEQVNVGGHMTVKRERRGNVEKTTYTHHSDTASKPVGFIDIADVEAVLRQTLRLGPPKKQATA